MKFSTIAAAASIAVAMNSLPTLAGDSKDYYTVPVADLAKNNMTEDMIRTDLTPVSQETTPTVTPSESDRLTPTPITQDDGSNYHTVRVKDLPVYKGDFINLTPVSVGTAPTTTNQDGSNYQTVRVADLNKNKMTEDMIRTDLTPVSQESTPTTQDGSNYHTVPVKDLPKYNKDFEFVNLTPVNEGFAPTTALAPCTESPASAGSANYHTIRVADLPKEKMTDDMIRTNLTPVSQGSTPSAPSTM
ncbi:hypothetical protein PHYBOEH_007996 [Phytophthora boehmeriae]|uniref:Uncharacterized protein n=1 Tax=Phytophthora boehmeriae TaxID=109152 RepID=A0A8T1W3J5_9STRA|nr:hypothetical protein PHYBOEH_007996 [Phytophthora boehmeriae]